MKPKEYAVELVKGFKPMVRAKMSEDEDSVYARAVECALHHINILLTLDWFVSESDENNFYDWCRLVKEELQKL